MIVSECKLVKYNVDSLGRIVFSCEVIFTEDGVELGRAPERYTVSPGDDVSNKEQYVQDICAQVHTQAVIDAWIIHVNTLN